MEFQELGKRMMLLHALRRRYMQRLNGDCPLYPGQLPILAAVLESPGCTQQDIAKRTRVTAASVALSAKRLERAGLIEKRVDPDNRRRNQLFATPAGRSAAIRQRESMDTVDAATFSALSPEDQAAAARLLDRMIASLAAFEEELPPFIDPHLEETESK